jgi:hypothetical protein
VEERKVVKKKKVEEKKVHWPSPWHVYRADDLDRKNCDGSTVHLTAADGTHVLTWRAWTTHQFATELPVIEEMAKRIAAAVNDAES